MPQLDSVVIVDNQFGSVATIRFDDRSFDRIYSTDPAKENPKLSLYQSIEYYVKKVTSPNVTA